MTWIKINDSFPDHPKVVGLSDTAFRTHLQGLCYCGRFLTDGHIPVTVIKKVGTDESIGELVEAGLWRSEASGGYLIHDYLEHQTSKKQVQDKQEALRERQRRYRAKKSESGNEIDDEDWDNAFSNALVTPSEDRRQKTEYRRQNTDIKDITTSNEVVLPRVNSAKKAVINIQNKLANARENGINAWNLSRLVEDEWDVLHNANDIGGCIALTAWYVSELQTRSLTSSEIGRIGQMTKRFGRIALLAIDEAASKDLTDLVSYAYRVAQNLYKEKAGK